MKKIKSVLVRLNLKGKGIVNFDHGEQKWFLSNAGLGNNRHNNTMYAKKNFYLGDDGKTSTYKIKISSDCLRNSMFNEDTLAQSANIVHNKIILHSFLASELAMLRGYVFISKNNTSYKRKSAVTMTDAEQTNNAVSYIEFHSKSGEKITKTDSDDTSDTSIYNRESVGDIEYEAFAEIDLNQLQFLSCDSIYDRFALNADDYDLFEKLIKNRIPNYNANLGYYKLNTTVNDIPELGIRFNDETVEYLTKEAIKKMLKINIKRATAHAYVDTVQIKLVEDATQDTFSNNDGWIDIKESSDIDNIDFGVYNYYDVVDTEQAKETRKSIEEEFENSKKLKKEKKETKAKAKTNSKTKTDDITEEQQ